MHGCGCNEMKCAWASIHCIQSGLLYCESSKK